MPTRKPAKKQTTSTTRRTTTKRTTSKTKTATRKPTARKAPAKKAAPKPDWNKTLQTERAKLNGQKVAVLTVPWELRAFVTTQGAKYNTALKSYLVPTPVPQFLRPWAAEPYSYEAWLEEELNGARSIRQRTTTMTPRKHQETAIQKIVASGRKGLRGFVLADQVGLGKTVSGLIGIAELAKLRGYTPQKPAKLLILAPKTVLPHWRNVINASNVDHLRIMVINYEQSAKLLDAPASAVNAKRKKTVNKNTALHGTPTIRWDFVIADEAHKLKNYGVQRSNAFSKIARYDADPASAPFVVWASATVGQNPLEVRYLAPLISQLAGGKPITMKDWGKWLISQHFNVRETKAGNHEWLKVKKEHSAEQKAWIAEQQKKDVQRMSEILFHPKAPSIRRNPEDIAGWPSQTHILTPAHLDADEMELYTTAWQEFRRELSMSPRGKNPVSALAATTRFRQKASLVMAQQTCDFVVNLLENGKQVAVSVQFAETVEAMKEQLEKAGYVVTTFSGQNVAEREEERLKFQRGEADVMLFTVTEAISLHAGEQLPDGSKASMTERALIIHDSRYSGIEMTQILGRATRDGQLAFAYYMYAEDTVQKDILEVTLQRMKNMRTMSGDNDTLQDEIHSLLDSMALTA